MKREVKRAASGGWLALLKPAFLASTYGISVVEVEREIVKFHSEGEGK